jgi:hypothetical protein
VQELAQQGGVPSAPALRNYQRAYREENRVIQRGENETVHETIKTTVEIWDFD